MILLASLWVVNCHRSPRKARSRVPTFWRLAGRSERCKQAFRPRSHCCVPINCGTPVFVARCSQQHSDRWATGDQRSNIGDDVVGTAIVVVVEPVGDELVQLRCGGVADLDPGARTDLVREAAVREVGHLDGEDADGLTVVTACREGRAAGDDQTQESGPDGVMSLHAAIVRSRSFGILPTPVPGRGTNRRLRSQPRRDGAVGAGWRRRTSPRAGRGSP